jgi:hypothetical protein
MAANFLVADGSAPDDQLVSLDCNDFGILFGLTLIAAHLELLGFFQRVPPRSAITFEVLLRTQGGIRSMAEPSSASFVDCQRRFDRAYRTAQTSPQCRIAPSVVDHERYLRYSILGLESARRSLLERICLRICRQISSKNEITRIIGTTVPLISTHLLERFGSSWELGRKALQMNSV